MNWAQVLRLLFSENPANILFVFETLWAIEEGLFGEAYDQPQGNERD